MAFTDDDAIERLARRMVDQTLLKSEWTHEGHFATALWLLRHRPDLTRPDEIRHLIMRFNDVSGTINSDTSGYHHTITVASLRGASDCLHRLGPDVLLHQALQVIMTSPLGRSDWLLVHWMHETLFSVAARKKWVEPDLIPLPF